MLAIQSISTDLQFLSLPGLHGAPLKHHWPSRWLSSSLPCFRSTAGCYCFIASLFPLQPHTLCPSNTGLLAPSHFLPLYLWSFSVFYQDWSPWLFHLIIALSSNIQLRSLVLRKLFLIAHHPQAVCHAPLFLSNSLLHDVHMFIVVLKLLFMIFTLLLCLTC